MSLIVSIIACSALAGLAIYKRALTPCGTALAWTICVAVCFLGGIKDFIIMAEVFIITVMADELAGSRADPNMLRRKSGRRDTVRVLCNVGTGGVAILLFAVSKNPVFELAYAAVMAESLADSMASKIGPLSKRSPVDICTLKPVEPGLSGGISVLGTLASMLGAMIVGGIILAFGGGVQEIGAVIICGFIGALLDSVYGSCLQSKYRCTVCGTVTEREIHCQADAVLCGGFRHINNDIVNLLSNISTMLLTLIIQGIGARV